MNSKGGLYGTGITPEQLMKDCNEVFEKIFGDVIKPEVESKKEETKWTKKN